MSMNRRVFLQRLLGGTAAVGLSQFACPSFLMAQAAGNGKNLVVLNLRGGADGLFFFPYLGDTMTEINQVRGVLSVTQNIHTIVADSIGMHENFTPLVNELGNTDDLKLISMAGITGSNERSHSSASKEIAVLSPHTTGASTGWIGRAKDNCSSCGAYSVWGIRGGGLTLDGPVDRYPALSIQNLNSFNFQNSGFSSEEAELLRSTSRSLLQVPLPAELDTENRRSVKETAIKMHESIPVVRDIRQITLNGDYGTVNNWTLGGRFSDAAKIIIDNTTRRNESTMITIGDGGFDTHGRQLGNLPNRITTIAQALAGFIFDMKANGLWNDTVVLVVSEFGRTLHANGTSESEAGTDHGRGNNLMILGGSIDGGGAKSLVGPLPTTAEIHHDRNYIVPAVDLRDVVKETMQWMGINASSVVTDNSYSSQNLSLFL